jgi:aminoglycoside/choline kinase family phosphotransferase
MQTRESALHDWLQTQYHHQPFTLTPLSGDASFRRYFRLQIEDTTRIIMDAPPDKESLAPFLHVQALLQAENMLTPTVHNLDQQQGFAILDDLGDDLFLNQLTPTSREPLYAEAIHTLVRMQSCCPNTLKSFDKQHMLQEMSLFEDWFLKAYLKLSLTQTERNLISTLLHNIASRVITHPKVFIHRDYHARNIMIIEDSAQPKIGIIDFQDAMLGPITYDLVSLLKDCYTLMPPNAYTQNVHLFYEQQPAVHIWSLDQFMDEIDYCGLQRHLKILGIFCRLHLRDNKPNYLNDLPLTMHYIMNCLIKQAAFKPLLAFMEARVIPRFTEACTA